MKLYFGKLKNPWPACAKDPGFKIHPTVLLRARRMGLKGSTYIDLLNILGVSSHKLEKEGPYKFRFAAYMGQAWFSYMSRTPRTAVKMGALLLLQAYERKKQKEGTDRDALRCKGCVKRCRLCTPP